MDFTDDELLIIATAARVALAASAQQLDDSSLAAMAAVPTKCGKIIAERKAEAAKVPAPTAE